MKKLCLFIICVFLPGIVLPQYQSKEFTTDDTDVISSIALNVSVSNEDSLILLQGSHRASGLFVSGCANLNNRDESYVRITLRDIYNSDYLVYELYPLLTETQACPFSKIGLETAYLDNIQVQSIKIETLNASVTLDSVFFVVPERSLRNMRKAIPNRKSQCEHIASRLNDRLVGGNTTWRAGVTFISQMTYEEKKGMFGGKVPVLYGFDYYKGGIFVMPGFCRNAYRSNQTSDADNYVTEWDWRNRHGKNWVTPVKSQGSCRSCWAFAAVGVLESYINLYYNDTINYDLSEEEIISCSTHGCLGGFEQYAYDYIKAYGIVNEDCFQYVGYKRNCNLKCPNPEEKIYIEDYDYYITTEDSIKRQLFRAPVTIGLGTWHHSMMVAGFKTITAGDVIYNGNSTSEDSIVINSVSHANLIGRTAWLIKNSWGESWGNNGYGYFIVDSNSINAHCYLKGNITSQLLTDNNIICSDADGDGLYFWGVGPKPAHCPSWVPSVPDGDDSNYQYGPMDNYGHLEDLELRGLQTTHIVTDSTFTSRAFFYTNTCVCTMSKLTIKSTITLYGNTKIIVEPNGEFVIDGGVLENADIELKSGSKLVLKNGGTIIMRNGKNFQSPIGATVKIEEGLIK